MAQEAGAGAARAGLAGAAPGRILVGPVGVGVSRLEGRAYRLRPRIRTSPHVRTSVRARASAHSCASVPPRRPARPCGCAGASPLGRGIGPVHPAEVRRARSGGGRDAPGVRGARSPVRAETGSVSTGEGIPAVIWAAIAVDASRRLSAPGGRLLRLAAAGAAP